MKERPSDLRGRNSNATFNTPLVVCTEEEKEKIMTVKSSLLVIWMHKALLAWAWEWGRARMRPAVRFSSRPHPLGRFKVDRNHPEIS